MPRPQPLHGFLQAIRLPGVVDEDRPSRQRRLVPVADAKIGADEYERAADGDLSDPGPDQLYGIPLAELRRRVEPAPKLHRSALTEQLEHFDRAPIAAAAGVP